MQIANGGGLNRPFFVSKKGRKEMKKMKEKRRSIKIYLLGMLITGTAIGVSSVVADTIINSTNVSYKTTTVKAALDDLYGLTADDIWQKIYPIGSIYTSVSPTSPATLFGGTWERFGNGKAIVGVDESDDDFKTVALTGGSKTKTIAVGNLPAHTHSVSINTSTAGSHSHSVSAVNAGGASKTLTGQVDFAANVARNANTNIVSWVSGPFSYITGNHQAVTLNSGVSSVPTFSHNYGFKLDASHTHQVPAHNTETVANHSHSVNGNTGSTGSGTALNTQDPYITVYMWKRTA